MKKETKMNNKGFSLVELIIVIAIMAILVGVLAPQLLKYIEKTNVSADVQLADAVKTAVQTAIMDPAVMADPDYSAFTSTNFVTATQLSDLNVTCAAAEAAIKETLGIASTADLSTLNSKLKSAHDPAAEIRITISTLNQVSVTITTTDSTGKKVIDGTAAPISVD